MIPRFVAALLLFVDTGVAQNVDTSRMDQTVQSSVANKQSIEELRSGKPNYDLMSPALAAATRQQLPQLQSGLQERGATQSIIFKGVGPGGADIYEIKFEKESWEYRIWLALDGRIDSANVQPLN
jgi:hypothetical protein